MDTLPKEIIHMVIHYAHPQMNKDIQESIKIYYVHRKLNILYKSWNIVYDELPWSGYIYSNTTKEERNEMRYLLKKCGCCQRHCPDVPIVGDRSIKKRHNKKTLYLKKCSCWCRHHYRDIENIDM